MTAEQMQLLARAGSAVRQLKLLAMMAKTAKSILEQGDEL